MGHCPIKLNRRQFFKTLAATAAGVVAVGVAPKAEVVVANGMDRSVVWGVATWDWEAGRYVAFNCEIPYQNITSFYHTINAVCVKSTEPIKKGQALVWNPNGTVRGLKPEHAAPTDTQRIMQMTLEARPKGL